MKYAITAATGNFGQVAVKLLNKLVGEENVIVVARNLEKATKMFQNNEVRQGDYDDKDAMIEALTDVDKVLFISSQPGGKVDRATAQKNVVDALVKNNVKFVAYTSFPKAEDSDNWLASDHKITEEAIKKAGLHHSFLHNNWYLENEMGFLQSGVDNQPAVYWTNGYAGWALEREYAEAAVKVLIAETPKEVYEFSGKLSNYKDLGYALQVVTGNDFAIKHVSEAEYIKYLENTGLKPEIATLFAKFDQPIDDGSLAVNSNDLVEVLGHPLLSLEDAIKEILAR
ncbi:NAD(P)H-binding protein [Lactobacillus mulieris]|uniref:NAD(P)H-binding protein n=1 Tax=Lactobacillus mulieris TaxID=2508708 RepID=UPI0014331562|nr:NAD(P)H-binding protein [Lactobacillus mulieris]MDK6803433.1 NAD(P)H-binding protein [Lactobacillus mulieris]MDK8382406.1 NAD(P)H-binding protein [Lactobacillus mulieris]MDT9620733.1 NAD(P)H-binding protein [Lactobacillus mulieris]NKC41651.1 NAD(P)H-binding protein [Lactobacillus mulieris]